MESRWYVPAGNVLENTKIEERYHALHVSKDNWKHLTSHLDRNRLLAEARIAEEKRKETMRENSRAMTENCSNSIQNIRKRKEEERQKMNEQKEDKNFIRYNELKKEQAEERKKYVEKVRKSITMKTEYPSALNSALRLGKSILERQKQQELKKKLRDHELAEEQKFIEYVKSCDEKAHVEDNKDRLERRKRDIQYAKELKEVAQAKTLEKQQKIQQSIEEEINNLEMSKREMETIETCKIATVLQRKADLQKLRQQDILAKTNHKLEKIKEEETLNHMNDVIRNAQDRIKCKIKQKEIEARESKLKEACEAVSIAEQQQQLQREKENENYKRDCAKQNAVLDKIEKEKLERQEKLRQERITDYKNFMDNKKIRAQAEMDVIKWDTLNRYKTNEVFKKEGEKEIEAQRRLTVSDVGQSRKEEEERIQKEKQEEKAYFKHQAEIIKQNDECFYQYADECLKYAKERGITTIPIEKVINRYQFVVQKKQPKQKPCAHYKDNNGQVCGTLLNTKPGKMAHDPASDPGYHKSQCRCDCHKDPLYK